MAEVEFTGTFPQEIRISDKVRAVVGHDDGHVDIFVTINLLVASKEVALRIEAPDVAGVERLVRLQKAWMARNTGK